MALKNQRRQRSGKGSASGADIYEDGTATDKTEGESFEPGKPSEADRSKNKTAPGKRGRQVGHEV